LVVLEEIEIPDCYSGRLDKFNAWRRAIAYNIGAPVWYGISEKEVVLEIGSASPPKRLPFCTAVVTDEALSTTLTAQQRLGDWASAPSEPLMIVLLLTVPGGVIRHVFARPIAERLREIEELIHFCDDGRFGAFHLTHFHHGIYDGMCRISARQIDSVVSGGYHPGGWWPGAVPKSG
jgi:hypothetical protein